MIRNKIRTLVTHWIQRQFDQVLYYYVQKRKNAYILQIGANDGKTLDPLYKLIRLPQVKAVLVEAVPFIYNKLCLTHKENDRVTPLNKVVVPTKTTDVVPFYYFEERVGIKYKNEYSWWGSLDEKYMSKYTSNNPELAQLLTRKMLSCVSIHELIQLTGFPEINVLHTDVEGLDAELINALNFDIISIDIILFEHYHTNQSVYLTLLAKLKQYGYKCYSHGFDTICIQQKAAIKTTILDIIYHIRPSLLKRPTS
ncbi:MAG: hypothetical protein E6Q89_09315 [Bacteroidia bacterium]|nr:MAG: hypothetical protein E6Q89_09315 [Bacteroidia bacterium]